ncbi:hypothetical protein GWO43_12865 [candidate division KSB1 bacterium]|nr:hypothetical protein [candidate division KSB1 bacterium]NIR71320.1 hypothetical protein [candidate division KSB1 bacterium]NIS24830.1 hypothetical protein [candidate division KSB1 bacterium]NIT71750.1 hypothetical protein [candidate division KSB1 bacterium]NIU25465.1 hypothetical protein [candidate division KSB1 bacterium]
MGGEIQKPGIIKFKGDLTLVQGILLAGGLKDRSTEYEAVIFRDRGDEGVKMFRIRIRKNDTENRDFKLAPNDVVFVLKPLSDKEKEGKLI